MARQEPHSRLITEAAREVLRPIGLSQKGRSRTWLDDHGWWVAVVEFQPSRWERGSYLNVGVTWLWHPFEHDPHLSFDAGSRVEGLVAYESEEQFAAEARRLAERAAEQVRALRAQFPDVGAAARYLSGQARFRQGWPRYNAGVALGLAGAHEESARVLGRVVKSGHGAGWWGYAQQEATRLRELVATDPAAFEARVRERIAANRAALRLPEVDGDIR